MRVARVFPRRTKASPKDALAFFDAPGLFPPEVDSVNVSVSFTWDLPYAYRLAEEWQGVAPVTVGGPALGNREGQFIPGQYLGGGFTITSRGCPNRCWFCSAWKINGTVTEYEIHDGYKVQDDNLLACSDSHIKAVFAMLRRQKHRAEFTGGLEAARLKHWHINEFYTTRISQMFFAYDTPDDKEPLYEAGWRLRCAGYNRNTLRTYVFIGYPRDTMEAADERLHFVLSCGMFPQAMLYRDPQTGETPKEWRKFQRLWARPAIIAARLNNARRPDGH